MATNAAPDRVSLVTGAGGRLGAAIAASLMARGSKLVLNDVDARSLDAVRRTLALRNGDVTAVVADVATDRGAHELVARAIAAFDRLDACINNAGIEGPVGPIEDVDLDAVVQVYQVNVFGMLRVMKALIPYFKVRKAGRIVNIASGAGTAGSPYMAPYSSSKHAVIGLTRSVAREVATDGIAVNAVCPGCIESPMMDRIEAALSERSGAPTSFVASVPLGRYARPDEVGELVAYLALDAPVYITGSAIVIDGGLRA